MAINSNLTKMAFDISKLKPENAKSIAILVGVLVAIGLAAYYINKTFGGIANAVGGVTDALGITNSPLQQATNDAVAEASVSAASPASPWSPDFYKNAPDGAQLLTQASADSVAEQIWDSEGVWYNPFKYQPEQAYAAIKQCSTQSQISYVSDRFNTNYSKDMWGWLTLVYTKMGKSDPNLKLMSDYVNNLPKYN